MRIEKIVVALVIAIILVIGNLAIGIALTVEST